MASGGWFGLSQAQVPVTGYAERFSALEVRGAALSSCSYCHVWVPEATADLQDTCYPPGLSCLGGIEAGPQPFFPLVFNQTFKN